METDMPNLTIVAHITAKADKIEFVLSELQKLIEVTLKEEGCMQYDLHQDNDNPAYFMFYETWESRELWQNHMATPHIHAYKAATADAVEHFALHEMTKVD